MGGSMGQEGSMGGSMGQDGSMGGSMGQEGSMGGSMGQDGSMGQSVGQDGSMGGSMGQDGSMGQSVGQDGSLGQSVGQDGSMGQSVGQEGSMGQSVGQDGSMGQSVGQEGSMGGSVGQEVSMGQSVGQEGSLGQSVGQEGSMGQGESLEARVGRVRAQLRQGRALAALGWGELLRALLVLGLCAHPRLQRDPEAFGGPPWVTDVTRGFLVSRVGREPWRDGNCEAALRCVALAAAAGPEPAMQLKLTALLSPRLCEKISLRLAEPEGAGLSPEEVAAMLDGQAPALPWLSPEENEALGRGLGRLQRVAQGRDEKNPGEMGYERCLRLLLAELARPGSRLALMVATHNEESALAALRG
uniref:uncharacterized protein n=1 Tax=Lonchura striata TaxID=40157 RepID=UPI001293017C